MTTTQERFPDDIAYGSSGGPAFSTTIVTNAGGYEKRNQDWQSARAAYNVSHGVKTKAQLDALIRFFRARKGRLHSFRFKDWTDFQGNGEIIGVGNSTQTHFQLIKTYTHSNGSDVRPITQPVEATVAIYLNAALQQNGFSVDYSTGIITFDAAPSTASIIQADFEFDVPVRFDTDHISARLEDYGVYSWTNIPLVEIKGGLS